MFRDIPKQQAVTRMPPDLVIKSEAVINASGKDQKIVLDHFYPDPPEKGMSFQRKSSIC